MSPAEAAALLAIAAAYDNRKPDADAATAWALALEDYDFADCRTAVVQHYRESRVWMMPVDVIEGVRKIRSQRLDRFGAIRLPPEELRDDLNAQHEWMNRVRAGVLDGSITRSDFPELAPPPLDQEAVDKAMAMVRAAMPKRVEDA